MAMKADTSLSPELASKVVGGLKARGWGFCDDEDDKLVAALVDGRGTAITYDSKGHGHVFIVRPPGLDELLLPRALQLYVCNHRYVVNIPSALAEEQFMRIEPETITCNTRCSFMSGLIFMFRNFHDPETTNLRIFGAPRLLDLAALLTDSPLEPAPDSAS